MRDEGDLLERATDLVERGYEAFRTGDVQLSRELNLEGLELARRARHRKTEVGALAGLMRLGLRANDFDAVEQLADECERVAAAADDRSLRRFPLHMRAEATRMKGNLETARKLYDASIALNRDLGNEGMVGIEMANKSWIEIHTGRLDEAERLLRGSLELASDEDPYGIAFGLLGLARVQLERGDDRGAETLGAAERLLEQAELVWDPAEEPEYERTVGMARDLAGARDEKFRASGRSRDPRSF